MLGTLLEFNMTVEETAHLSCPLYHAALNSHADAFSILVDHGANIPVRNAYSQTAFNASSASGHNPLLEILLLRGADIKARDTLGWTPLH